MEGRLVGSAVVILKGGTCVSEDIYTITVKREYRRSEPDNWKEQIQDTGIQILPTTSSRLRVRATDEAISRVRLRLGDVLHIEKQIDHHR